MTGSCSTPWVRVHGKTKELEILQNDFSQLQHEILPLKDIVEFVQLDKQVNDKLEHLEKNIIDHKKEKMVHDTLDYDSNNVY